MVRFFAIVVGLLAIVLLALLFQWSTPARAPIGSSLPAPAADLVPPYAPDELPPLQAATHLRTSPSGPPLSAAERAGRQPPPFNARGMLASPVASAAGAGAASADARLLDILLLSAAALSMLLVTAGGYLLGGKLRSAPDVPVGALPSADIEAALSGAEQQLEQLRQRLGERESEVASLQEMLESAQALSGAGAVDVREALEAARQQVSTLTEQAGEVDQDIALMHSRLAEAQTREEQLQAECDRLHGSHDGQADALSAGNPEEAGQLKNMIGELERELDEWRALWREAEPRLARQQKAIMQLESELDASSDTIRGLRRHIASVQSRLHKARESDKEFSPGEGEFPEDEVDAWISQYRKDEPD